jgi:Mlc titration factor MtfA (ptsG expression regulator)
MYWRWLAVPLVIIALFFLYLTWEVDDKYALYIVPPVVLTAALIVFSPQIDWLLAKRKPPEIPDSIRHLINQRSPYYQLLSADAKKRFRDRLALFIMAFDFKPQAMERVPEDVKAIVAFYAAQITLAFEDFLLPPFEHVIVYRGPFPTPQYPAHWHISETFLEDGVLIYSADHLMQGFLHPLKYYPIGLHEMAQAFLHKHPQDEHALTGESVWEDIRQITGVDKERLQKYIGLPEVPALPVCIVYFFTLPQRFRTVRPDLYEALAGIFGQDPAAGGDVAIK